MKKKMLVDITISCDPPRQYYYRRGTMEEIAQSYEEWVKDFESFMRDHRSQDPVSLNVERQYQDVCSFCESEWDEDENGCPCCCDEAMKEYEEARLNAEVEKITAPNISMVGAKPPQIGEAPTSPC
jgi:hypothetical protein